MYDVLISTHCARDWGAYADPVTCMLHYRPYLLKRDLQTMASVPLIATAARSWEKLMAAGVFVCGVTACASIHTEHQPHEADNNGSKPSQAHTSAKPPQSAAAGQTQ
eukprot:298984-Pelagomonas_calceolata.AAC.1